MYQQPNLINSQTALAFLPKLQQFRATGPIEEYKFDSIKPKKKLKEIKKVLLPEKKKFIFRYGYKFNLKDRCVVCGMHHIWEAGDYLRPPIPLDKVEKGRPLRGTYCPKHAAIHKQMEMLQQQIMADEHGLDFKAFVPRPKIPQMMKSGPLTTLSQNDIASLSAIGWIIKSPDMRETETPMDELKRLVNEIENANVRIQEILKTKDGE